MKKIKFISKKKNSNKLGKKVLIISQLKKKNNLLKSSVIYLSEGSLPNSIIGNNFNKELVPIYPHLKSKIVYKNYFYLLDIYELFLQIISDKLNKIHKVNYSKNYWRVLIGVWLFTFISIIFDNWNRLKYINKRYNIRLIEVAKIKSSSFLFKDYNDFVYNSLTDSFSNCVCNDLLKFFKKKKINYFTYNKKKEYFNNNFNYKSILNIILNILKNFFVLISNFSQKDNNAVFHDTYFDKKTFFLLQVKLRQIPTLYKSITIDNKFYNKEIRLQKFKNLKDPFAKILANLVFKYMPLSYLENYNYYLNKINNINWPKKPKFIFSSNSFFYDDFFKFWLAEKKEKFKTKFITGQHGGHFFTTKFMFLEKHQNDISNSILTWGYNKKKFKSVFNFKTLNKKIKFENNGKLLFIHYEISRFPCMHSTHTRFSYLVYLKDQFNFINELNKNVANELTFRKYPINLGWKFNIINLLKKKHKNLLIDKNKDIDVSLSNSRICFVNFNSTVYLETLNLNFPTIIFFNTNNDEINEETKKYLNILKKVGIYFDNYKMAAKKINEVWDDVDGWWYSNSVQNAVHVFCNKFSKRAKKNIVNKLFYSIIN
jgi:putative transferase (TIGR04331 family)